VSDRGGRLRRAALLALLLGPSLARGQGELPAAEGGPPPAVTASPTNPAAPSDKRQAAKEHFQRGLELARQQDWSAALAEFQASRELFPTRVALLNAAISLQWLRRRAEALTLYQELRRGFGPQLTANESRQIDTAIAELEPFVGTIDVTSNVAGAVVLIDGQEQGRTPLSGPQAVTAGLHVVRVAKSGYEAFLAQVTVAGRQHKTVRAMLLEPSQAGLLRVEEASGKKVQVLLDGAPVGTTPWQGSVRAGKHSIALRGPGHFGTAPVTALVRLDQLSTLTLPLLELSADVRIEPVPMNAGIDIDGISLGAGLWHGRLPSGSHRLEVYAEGHVPSRKLVLLRPGSQVIRVTLERDPLSAFWQARPNRLWFAELTAGPAFAFSFGGDAAASCGQSVAFSDQNGGGQGAACRDRSRPFGWLVAARLGYRFSTELALEATAGYLDLRESMLRRLEVDGEPDVRLASTNLRDRTRLSAPLAAVGASYQVLDRTPLVFRVLAGVARASVRSAVEGDLSGKVPFGEPTDPDYRLDDYRGHLSLMEDAQHLWIPFTALEVRVGYRISPRLTLDVGLASWFLFAPSYPRTGGDFGDSQVRRASLPPSAQGVRGGVVQLPSENSLATMVLFTPTIGARWHF
jgi:hypothetical protein